jgi:hypothetical protein
MARFPRTEPEVIALSQAMVSGLTANAVLYPAPPVLPAALTTLVSAYTTAKNAAIAALAAAEQKTADKDDAIEALTDAMKSDIRYAENKVNYDDDKLKLIGWAGKKAPTDLQPPGQARLLEAPRQGEGWVFLDWKQPAEGGKVSAYKIQRRNRPEGTWQDVATAIETESTLVEQPKGAELESARRIGGAINKSGEGSSSNTVMAVL